MLTEACSSHIRFSCVALRHDASGFKVYFRHYQCFILDTEKLAFLQRDLVVLLLQHTECVTEYGIIEIASWRIVTERSSPSEKRIRVGRLWRCWTMSSAFCSTLRGSAFTLSHHLATTLFYWTTTLFYWSLMPITFNISPLRPCPPRR